MSRGLASAAWAAFACTLVGATTRGTADSSSGVDAVMFRPSFDTSGVFSLEGARLPTRHDLSWKMFLGYAKSPLNLAVPGIDGGAKSSVLDYTLTLDMAFGFTISKRLAVGMNAAVYRTDTGAGYGDRGRFRGGTALPSTGLISLRPISNIDPSGGFEDQGLSGPLDVRLGLKYMLVDAPKLAVTAMATMTLPFGNDELFVGDQNIIWEPRLSADFRPDPLRLTKLVLNAGAKIRQRTVLEAYDAMTLADGETAEEAALAVLDVGSEAFAGVGGIYEVSPRVTLGAEVVGYIPLPGSLSYGTCYLADLRLCSELESADWAPGTDEKDVAAYGVGGAHYRVNPHLTASAAALVAPVGARGDDVRIMFGAIWSPQPAGEAKIGRGDSDGDRIPDLSDGCREEAEDADGYQDDDGCPDVDNDGDGIADADDTCRDEAEDRDTFKDEDGCPERDNDGDGIQDATDRCPDEPEDVDGFEDDDGCRDEDNDGDGFADKLDRCPDEAETVNGVDDEDGCVDVRVAVGPVEAADRIDLRGNKIEFAKQRATLTDGSKATLAQVANLIKNQGLVIRIEAHVALGTTSKNAGEIRRQAAKDKALAERRAQAVFDYLKSQGVAEKQLTGAVGLGSDRPLGNNPPTDPLNERVDFIKAQRRTP